MFVYGDVVILKIGRYWPWKTVIASSHRHMPVRPTLLHRMALVSFLLFRKNLGNLREFFGQMVYCPPGKKLPIRVWDQRLIYKSLGELGTEGIYIMVWPTMRAHLRGSLLHGTRRNFRPVKNLGAQLFRSHQESIISSRELLDRRNTNTPSRSEIFTPNSKSN